MQRQAERHVKGMKAEKGRVWHARLGEAGVGKAVEREREVLSPLQENAMPAHCLSGRGHRLVGIDCHWAAHIKTGNGIWRITPEHRHHPEQMNV